MEEELKSMKLQVVSRVDPCMNELYRMWMDIGYTQDEQQGHLRSTAEKIETFLNDLILNQRAVRRQLEAEVEQETVAIHKMCTDLQIPVFYPPRDIPLLALQRILVEKRSELERQFRERLERHAEVACRLTRICAKLGDVSSDTCEYMQLMNGRACPSANDLLVGERNCGEFETLFRSRLERFNDVRSDVVRLVDELEYEFESEAESQIVNTKFCNGTELNATANAATNNANCNALRHKLSGHSQSQASLKAATCSTSSPRVRETPNDSTDRLDGGCNGPKADNDAELTSPCSDLALSEATLREVDAFRMKLVKRKAFLVGTIEETRARLVYLWRRLAVDATYTESFLEECSSATGAFKESTLRRLRDEEKRLTELKLANASAYINSLLQEIHALHDSCYVNADEEATQVDESYSDKNNEELVGFIENLEKQVEELSAYRDEHKSVFDAIARFESARRELTELEARLKTPEVLCNRGGILLKLQKEQKSLQKEVPKLESEILAAISDAEKSEGVHIDVFGVPFREYVDALRSEATQKVRSSSRRRTGTAAGGEDSAPTSARRSSARTNSPSRSLRK